MPTDKSAPETPKSETASTKPDAADAKKTARRVKTGVAVGIGSAAIVAALLYANRSKK